MSLFWFMFWMSRLRHWDFGGGGAVAGHKLQVVHEAPRTCLTILCEHKLWTDSDIRKQSFRTNLSARHLSVSPHTVPWDDTWVQSKTRESSQFWEYIQLEIGLVVKIIQPLESAPKKSVCNKKILTDPHWSTNNSPYFVLIYLSVPNLAHLRWMRAIRIHQLPIHQGHQLAKPFLRQWWSSMGKPRFQAKMLTPQKEKNTEMALK